MRPTDHLAPVRSKAHSFVALDGLRGIAALAVILFHLPGLLGPLRLPRGYLAVDFFFLLSGFVLQYAYGERLRQGWSSRAFLLVRCIRLYPLYVLGTCSGFAIAFLPMAHEANVGSGKRMLARLALGLCLMPAFVNDAWLFPLNFPSWSIMIEAAGNVVHALLLRRRGVQVLLSIALVGAIASAWAAVRVGSMNFGALRPVASFAAFRLAFGYTVGMLLCLLWKRKTVHWRLSGSVCAIVLCGIFALPTAIPDGVIVDILCAIGIFPVLVFAAAHASPGPHLGNLCKFFGDISYAVYLLHMPLFGLFAWGWPHPVGRPVHISLAMGSLYLPILLFIAWLATRYFDRPLRLWLTRKLQPYLL